MIKNKKVMLSRSLNFARHQEGSASCSALPHRSEKILCSTNMEYGGFVFVVFATLCISATSAEESCSISSTTLDRAMARLIGALPETFPFPGDEEAPVMPGLFAGPTSLLGLNQLRVAKPYRVYCEENRYGEVRTMVSIDFTTNVNKGLALNFPWRYCGGKSGTVKLDLRKTRFTVIFEATNKAGEEDVTLRAVELHPIWMEDIVPHVEGLGNIGAQAGVAFGKIFPQVLRDLWVNILPNFVTRIMQDTARQM